MMETIRLPHPTLSLIIFLQQHALTSLLCALWLNLLSLLMLSQRNTTVMRLEPPVTLVTLSKRTKNTTYNRETLPPQLKQANSGTTLI